jgi:hypothetical protein
MKVLMTIPLDLYRVLESKCEASSQRSTFLKSGLIKEEQSEVAIRCNTERALEFISWANTFSPSSASRIEALPDE